MRTKPAHIWSSVLLVPAVRGWVGVFVCAVERLQKQSRPRHHREIETHHGFDGEWKAPQSCRIALGKSEGTKERQGNHKTPEGEYVIDQKNAQSRFHLALHISYPNAADRKRAHDAGADPGGPIMIHGVAKRFAWLNSLQHEIDWTDGCIAVTNREIKKIWHLVQVGTPVEIKP